MNGNNRNAPGNFAGKADLLPHSIVYGLRNWRVRDNGDLCSVMYTAFVWGPGVNHATCMSARMSLSKETFNPYLGVPTAPPAGYPLNHPMDDCAHGFYAYYDGSLDYHDQGEVTGIIKGWGEGVIGSKGFRVLVAEIVAIKFDPGVSDVVRERVAEKYPGVALFSGLAPMLAAFPTTATDLEVIPDPDDPFWKGPQS